MWPLDDESHLLFVIESGGSHGQILTVGTGVPSLFFPLGG
jgi:hypothetical protein